MILEQRTGCNLLDIVPVRVKLYKVHLECKDGIIVEDLTEEGICSKRISVTTSVRINPGIYLIVPHTDREEFEREFMVAIYTPTPVPSVR